MNFDDKRNGTGVNEWADSVLNISTGCSNDCIYCYAACNAAKKGSIDRKEWNKEQINHNIVIPQYKKDSVVMFPSEHDITYNNLNECTETLLQILKQDCKILIVSKPRLDCIVHLVNKLQDYKDKILFRFTIGTMNAEKSKFWEPNAPLPLERVDALRYAFSNGFKTSISIEPMLEGALGTCSIILNISPYVTHSIWIGKMNRIRDRIDQTNSDYVQACNEIEEEQSDRNILLLVSMLKNHQKILWKDSIKKVIEKYK